MLSAGEWSVKCREVQCGVRSAGKCSVECGNRGQASEVCSVPDPQVDTLDQIFTSDPEVRLQHRPRNLQRDHA